MIKLKFLFLWVIFLSQGLLAQGTVIDQIIRDYLSSTSFTQLMGLYQPHMIPGDDVFLYKKLKNAPELLRVKKLPSATYENGMFTLRYNKADYSFRFSDREKFEFELNNQKILMHPSTLPSVRWAKINEALTPKSAIKISFMPIAFAQQNGEATFSNVIIFSIISRLVHEATQGLEIRSENSDITFLQVMKKIGQYKSHCHADYLNEVLQKMASIQVASVKCESAPTKEKSIGRVTGNVIFNIPTGDGNTRTLLLSRSSHVVEETNSDPSQKKIIYKKMYSDSDVDFALIDTSEKKRRRSLRQKGLQWVATGVKSDVLAEKAEQMRELVNFSHSSDFCNRCGLAVRKALQELVLELEMNPHLDSYGRDSRQAPVEKTQTPSAPSK